jgi:hypothetical protein
MVPKQSVDESKDDDFLKKIGIKGVVGWFIFYFPLQQRARKRKNSLSLSFFLSTFKFQDVHLW